MKTTKKKTTPENEPLITEKFLNSKLSPMDYKLLKELSKKLNWKVYERLIKEMTLTARKTLDPAGELITSFNLAKVYKEGDSSGEVRVINLIGIIDYAIDTQIRLKAIERLINALRRVTKKTTNKELAESLKYYAL